VKPKNRGPDRIRFRTGFAHQRQKQDICVLTILSQRFIL
jgi:hypothetical protein